MKTTSLLSLLSLSLGILAPLAAGCTAGEDPDTSDTDSAEDTDGAGETPEGGARQAQAAGKLVRVAMPVKGQYIVTLREDGRDDTNERAARMIGRHRGQLLKVYRSVLKGFSARLSEEEALRLAADPEVESVEEDSVVTGDFVQSSAPWGLDRIDSRTRVLDGKYVHDNKGVGVHAYILDSGIRHTHQEFTGRIGDEYDAIELDGDASDCNGHGTHVAGTVGGTTYGVAKSVTLHPVRVLDCLNEGWSTQLLDAIDWVLENHQAPAVVNMSLSLGGVVPSVDAAVQSLVDAGITVVVSAGNSAADACNYSPARAAAAITVGATDSSDSRSIFWNGQESNYGSCLDLFAPGSEILSAYFTSDTASADLWGTSMAAPHVTGAVALYLKRHASASPAEVATALINSAALGVVSDEGSGSPDRLLDIGFHTITIQASTNQYFTATNGGGGSIYATSYSAGTSEKFNIVDADGGGLQSGDQVFLQSYLGHYFTAANGGGSSLTATSTSPGASETFIVLEINGTGQIKPGDSFAIQTSSGHYVVSDYGGNSIVKADRTAVGPWETFKLGESGL